MPSRFLFPYSKLRSTPSRASAGSGLRLGSWLGLLLVVSLVAGPALSRVSPQLQRSHSLAALSALERALLDELDQQRRRAGAPTLDPDPLLERAARERAVELAARDSIDSSKEEVTRLDRRLWQLGYGPHLWRTAVLAGDLDLAMLGKTRFDRELLRDTFEHAVAACVPRGAGSQRLCLLLVAERTLGFDLRAAEPLRDQGQVRESVLREVNKRRTKAGLKPLSANPAADRAAQAHAEAMLEQGFYAHRAPDDGSSPKDRATREGLVPRVIAENIAKVVTTPEDVVARWMSSSAHRRNLLLRSATQHGLGVAVGIQDGEVVALWCQLIASP